MDLATFQRQALRLPNDVSVFVRGAHGIGKTKVVYTIAETFGLPVMQRRLSQLSEGDLIGLPDKVQEGQQRYSTFLPMKWFNLCRYEPHLIFLDEIDRALPEVIQAAFELCYDRSIQGKMIHEGCRIYAAGNSGTKSSAYQVSMLDPAFLSRFWVADVRPPVEEWLEWAKGVGVHEFIISFIEDESEHLEISSVEKLKPEYIYPSRRSWYRLHQTLSKADMWEDPDLLAMCTGFIGPHAATAFVRHVKAIEKRVSAEDVLNKYGQIYYRVKGSSIEEKNKLINKLYKHSQHNLWDDDQIRNIINFLETLPDELKMIFNDNMTSLVVRQENAQKYIKASHEIMRRVATK